jgi:hypothetical protein
VNTELLTRVRDSLPEQLNAGILMGDGGFCILGWIVLSAGYHPIAIYGSTCWVNHPETGGTAVDVVARLCDLAPDAVRALGEVNDATPAQNRVDAVRAHLDELLASS